jgi:hypothetical protein
MLPNREHFACSIDFNDLRVRCEQVVLLGVGEGGEEKEKKKSHGWI